MQICYNVKYLVDESHMALRERKVFGTLNSLRPKQTAKLPVCNSVTVLSRTPFSSRTQAMSSTSHSISEIEEKS